MRLVHGHSCRRMLAAPGVFCTRASTVVLGALPSALNHTPTCNDSRSLERPWGKLRTDERAAYA